MTYTAPNSLGISPNSSAPDSFNYTVSDEYGDLATGLVNLTVNNPVADPGPTAGTVTAAANLGQPVDLTAAILAQVKPGLTGDTETITAVGLTSKGGVVTLTNGELAYSAPSNGLDLAPLGSTVDTFSYTVTDQLGDHTIGTVNVTVTDPVIANNGSVTVGHQQTVNLTSTVYALFPATETLLGVGALYGTAQFLNGSSPSGAAYIAPAGQLSSDQFGYKVQDQYGNTANGSIAVTIDQGPTAGTVAAVTNLGQTADLTAAIMAQVVPGLHFDTETITAVGTTGAGGVLKLTNGDLTYDALSSSVHVPANGSLTDTFSYTVTDQVGDQATGTVNVTVNNPVADPGPTAGTVTASTNRGQTVDLTSAILAQVKPGLTGDTETITAFGTTSAGGVVKLTNGDLTYALSSTIPANGSVTDTFTYTVKDQLGDTATGTVNVKVGNPDPGPTAGAVAASTNHGLTVDLTSAILAQVKPGLVGDIETITAVGTTSAGGVLKLTNGDLTYSAQGTVPPNGSVTDTFTYTVTDEVGDKATGTVSVKVGNPDPGPTAGAVVATANLGQTVDLKAAILAQVKPGLVGDTETITAFGTTSAGGVVKLTNGDLTYGALSSGLLSQIPANGSVVDTFTYTVTDEVGDKATGSVKMTVSNPAVVINGPPKGSMIINGGTQTNIANSTKAGNTIIEGGGNDIVNVTAGSANVSTGSGNVVVNLSGQNTTVIGGNGNDTVNVLAGGNNNVTLGTGTDSIVEAATSKGSNTFILNGSHASLLLYGANDVAFIHGGTDTITDDSKGLEVKIGSQGGVITLNNFLADKTGFVDLVGVGGFKTAKAVVAALQSDGHGGTQLSLGTAGHIDFANTAMASLTAPHFAIG